MDNTQLEQLIKDLKSNIKKGDVYYDNSKIKSQFNTLLRYSIKFFPDQKENLLELKKQVMNKPHGPFGSDIIKTCDILKEYLSKKRNKDSKEQQTFLNPQDLIKRAGLALKEGNEAYCIHLCDSAIEAFLKQVFDIPSTIVGAGPVKFLSECMILKIPEGMELYLKECKNKVCQMHNQVKHKAYVPSRVDAINSLKATEELLARKSFFRNLTLQEKRKVQIGIGLIKK